MDGLELMGNKGVTLEAGMAPEASTLLTRYNTKRAIGSKTHRSRAMMCRVREQRGSVRWGKANSVYEAHCGLRRHGPTVRFSAYIKSLKIFS